PPGEETPGDRLEVPPPKQGMGPERGDVAIRASEAGRFERQSHPKATLAGKNPLVNRTGDLIEIGTPEASRQRRPPLRFPGRPGWAIILSLIRGRAPFCSPFPERP